MATSAELAKFREEDLPNFGKSQPTVPAKPYVPPSPSDALTDSTLESFQGTPLGIERRANATTYGDKAKVVGGNMEAEMLLRSPAPGGIAPKSTAAEAMAFNAANPSPPTNTVYTNNGSNIVAEQRPTRITPVTAPSGIRNLALNQRAGNLDIQFDPGTDQGAIRRFMEQPVRPTAQIDRYNATVGNDAEQGRMAANNAARILSPNNNREAPKVGWQERKAYNLQAMQNAQAGEAGQLQAETSRLGFRNQREIAVANDAIQSERNKITAADVASQGGYRDAQGKLALTQAAELPKENESQRGLRSAQESKTMTEAEAAKIVKFKVRDGGTTPFGEPTYKEVGVDQKTGKVVDPQAANAPAQVAVPPPEKRVKGKTYDIPGKGSFNWNGKSWDAAQ